MDLAVLQWAGAMVAVVFLITLLVLRTVAPEEGSWPWWIAATTLLLVAALLSATRMAFPEAAVVTLANVMGVVASALYYQAWRVMLGHRPHWWQPPAFGGYALVVCLIFRDPEQVTERIVWVTPSVFTLSVLTAVLAWRDRDPLLRGVTRTLAVLCSLFAAGILFRALVAGMGVTSSHYQTTTNPAVSGLHWMAIVLLSSAEVLVTWVVTVRHRAALAAARAEAEEANELLLASSWIDPTTGVAHRARILGVLESEIDFARATSRPVCVLLITLDRRTVEFDVRRAESALADAAAAAVAELALSPPVLEEVGRVGDDSLVVILSGRSAGDAERVARGIHARLPGGSECAYVVTEVHPDDDTDTVLARLNQARPTSLALGSGWVETV